MVIIETPSLAAAQKQQILRIWNSEYPARISYDAEGFENYLANLAHKNHYLLITPDEEVKGWLFLFERDGANWFAMMLDKSMQRQGYGRALLDKVTLPGTLYGWVVDGNSDVKNDGTFYQSPLAFYLKLGFITHPTERLETEQISAVKISKTV
jgi:GNAT superfamily N-acetyltransferase